jgi:hypothetical protein
MRRLFTAHANCGLMHRSKTAFHSMHDLCVPKKPRPFDLVTAAVQLLSQRGTLCFKSALGLEEQGNRVLSTYAAYYNQTRPAPGITDRCAFAPCSSTIWRHCRYFDFGWAASPIRPDMIFGKDS